MVGWLVGIMELGGGGGGTSEAWNWSSVVRTSTVQVQHSRGKLEVDVLS